MNRWDINDARSRYYQHPVLGPATRTLVNLRDCADQNSDGWAYWPKPARAARLLMELIDGPSPDSYYDRKREDATPEKLKRALAPIKAFRTRSKLSFVIEEEVRR